jgi:hypothetical protein
MFRGGLSRAGGGRGAGGTRGRGGGGARGPESPAAGYHCSGGVGHDGRAQLDRVFELPRVHAAGPYPTQRARPELAGAVPLLPDLPQRARLREHLHRGEPRVPHAARVCLRRVNAAFPPTATAWLRWAPGESRHRGAGRRSCAAGAITSSMTTACSRSTSRSMWSVTPSSVSHSTRPCEAAHASRRTFTIRAWLDCQPNSSHSGPFAYFRQRTRSTPSQVLGALSKMN